MSAAFLSDSRGMRAHCVSRPVLGMSRKFLNYRGNLHADCVSRRLPVNSLAWRLSDRSATDPKPHALSALVFSVLLVPPRARTPVPLALTLCGATHPLSIARTRMGPEPATTNATRAGAKHPPA